MGNSYGTKTSSDYPSPKFSSSQPNHNLHEMSDDLFLCDFDILVEYSTDKSS